MTTVELSDTQRQILTAGCGRKGGFVLPAATTIRGGALKKVLGSMLSRGLVQEVPASATQEVWRTAEDGTAFTLRVTTAAHEAVGTKPKREVKAAAAKPAPKQRADTKQATVIAMLKRPKGATIEDIVAATDWQPHTVRGFFAGALKSRLGLEVTSDKDEARGRVYRIAS